MSEELIDKWIEVTNAMAPDIDPQKSALLIIDMQEQFVSKDGGTYKSMNSMVPGILDYYLTQVSKFTEPNIKRLVDLFREKRLKIIYTKFSSFNKDGSDLIPQWKKANEMAMNICGDPGLPYKDSHNSQIIDSIKPRDQDLVIIKNTSGVFTSTKLELFIKNMDIEQLFVVGVITNMCVEGAARTAAEYGFDVFMIDDACAAWSPEIHKNTLRSFQMLFGYVMTTDDVIKKIKEKS